MGEEWPKKEKLRIARRIDPRLKAADRKIAKFTSEAAARQSTAAKAFRGELSADIGQALAE
jgi:hypothetical protein